MMDWFFDKITGAFAAKYIGALIRSSLAAAAGWLVAIGLPADKVADWQGSNEVIVAGVATYVGTLVWSWIQKYKSQPKLK